MLTTPAAGGVEVVVKVVKRRRDGPAPLLEQACWVLKNIAVDADNHVKCGAAGGVEAVVEVVKRHRDGPAVLLENACGAPPAGSGSRWRSSSAAGTGPLRYWSRPAGRSRNHCQRGRGRARVVSHLSAAVPAWAPGFI
jgi:hypothetical protein